MRIARLLKGACGLAGVLLVSMCVAAGEEEATNSGFLGDDGIYAKLEEVEIHKDVTAQRWASPALTGANYQAVLVDDVLLYPEPEPGPQVSAETLEEVSAYLSEQLRTKVGSVLTLADAPGPGVLQMQTAVTGVLIKTEGMKAHEVVPVAAVFGGLKAVTGKRDRDVHVFIEARLVDSQSGKLVGAVVRKVQGEDLKGKKDQLTLEDMQKSLDAMSDDAAAALPVIMASEAD